MFERHNDVLHLYRLCCQQSVSREVQGDVRKKSQHSTVPALLKHHTPNGCSNNTKRSTVYGIRVYVCRCSCAQVCVHTCTNTRTRVRARLRRCARAHRWPETLAPCPRGAEANAPLIAAASAAPAEPYQLQPSVWQLLGAGLHFVGVGFEVLSPLV